MEPNTPDPDPINWDDWGTEEPARPIPQRKEPGPISDPRINFHLAPNDVMVECPYNRMHLIRDARLLIHLSKCRRNYMVDCARIHKKAEIVICRYNWKHHIHELEIDAHERTCPTQPFTYDQFPYTGDSELRGPSSTSTTTPLEEASSIQDRQIVPEAAGGAAGGRAELAGTSSSASGNRPLASASTWSGKEENWDEEWEDETKNGPSKEWNPLGQVPKCIPFVPVPPGLPKSIRRAYRQEQARNFARQQASGQPRDNFTNEDFEIEEDLFGQADQKPGSTAGDKPK